MNVVPVTSQGDGENKNDDYDQADIFQPLVGSGTTCPVALAVAQCFEHGAIVTEHTPSMATACAGQLYQPGGCWPCLLVCHCQRRDEIPRTPPQTCAWGRVYSGSASVWLPWPWRSTGPSWMRSANCEWAHYRYDLQFEYPSRSAARFQPAGQMPPPSWP